MTYAKPEVREIGAAAEMIQGTIVPSGNDAGQYLPRSLSLEDSED